MTLIDKTKGTYLQMIKSRTIIIAGIFFITTLSYFLIFSPIYKGYVHTKGNIKIKTETYKDSLSIINEKNSLMEKLKVAENKFKEAENGFLKGTKPPVAAAELQQIIKGMASVRGIDIRAEKMLQLDVFPGYIGVPVEIEFQSQMSSLKELLFDIEHSTTIILIPEIKIRVANIMEPTDIQVNIVVEGIIKKAESAKDFPGTDG